MGIIKVETVGQTYAGHVTECSEVAGKFGPQVRFTFANGDTLYIGKETADRQLIRATFDAGGDPPQADYAAVVGNTLSFSRTPNKTPGAKPYYNIAVASAADAKPQTPSKRLPGPTTVPGEAPAASDPKRAVAGLSGVRAVSQTQIAQAYARTTKEDVEAAFEWAWNTAVRVQGGKPSADTTQAGAATLLIALQKEGLVAGFSLVKFEDVKAALDLEAPDGEYEESLPF